MRIRCWKGTKIHGIFICHNTLLLTWYFMEYSYRAKNVVVINKKPLEHYENPSCDDVISSSEKKIMLSSKDLKRKDIPQIVYTHLKMKNAILKLLFHQCRPPFLRFLLMLLRFGWKPSWSIYPRPSWIGTIFTHIQTRIHTHTYISYNQYIVN